MTAVAQTRDRWMMGVEARALVLLTAVLLALGLAVLYSASAIVALSDDLGSAHYLIRQLIGLAVGVVAFAVAAKMDAERWSRWAWPFMAVTIVVFGAVAIFAAMIGDWVRRKPAIGKRLNVFAGLTFIALGIRVALPDFAPK